MSLLEEEPAVSAAIEGMRRGDFLKRSAALGIGATTAGALLAASKKADAAVFPDIPGGTRRPDRGLRAHINRFSHLVIHVSDLERARTFYEAVFPVKTFSRTNGPAQPYPSLGLKRGQFDGYLLRNPTQTHPLDLPERAIHLVEWKDPKPVGSPYPIFFNVGFYRTSALTQDIFARHADVIAAGGVPWGPPTKIITAPDGSGPLAFGFKDPDGSTLEWIQAGSPDPNPAAPEYTNHQNINCRHLSRSFPFYQDVIGLDYFLRAVPPGPQPPTNGSLGAGFDGDVMYDAPFFGYRNDTRSPIDLLEWETPRPFGKPYQSPFNLGIIRLAFEVDDIDAAYHALIEIRGKGNGKGKGKGNSGLLSGPISRPEEWDMGEFGTRKVVIFRDPDGVFLELIERPPYYNELA